MRKKPEVIWKPSVAKLANPGGTPFTVRPLTYSSKYSPIRSNGPILSQPSTLQAVRSSAPGRTNGEREPSEFTNRFKLCDMFVPLSSRLFRTSAPSFRKDPFPKTSLNNMDSSLPTYMKLLLSLFVMFRPFPLTHLDLCPGELMPVDEDVRGLERCSARIKSVAVFKIAFQLEIELLGKIASEIDSCAAQAETILQRRLTKAALERRDITVFEIHLDESAQHQFQFRATLLHIDRRFFFDDSFLDIRFSVVSHLLFEFAVGYRRGLFGLQAFDLRF